MIAKRIETHLVRHIWEAYAKKFLAENPDCYGKYHNKIKNYYIFNNGTRRRKVRLHYPSRSQNVITHSMQGLVNSYEIFRGIVEEYLNKARHAVIQGEAVHIAVIGKILAKRVERDYTKKTQRTIDWDKTKKMVAKEWDEDKQKFCYPRYIYFPGDDWCRIGWSKNAVHNICLYEFAPTNATSGGTKDGFKEEFAHALIADPLLKYQYFYAPLKVYRRFIAQPETPLECSTT